MNYQYGAMLVLTLLLGVVAFWRWLPLGRLPATIVQAVVAVPQGDPAAEAVGADEVRGAPLQAARGPAVAVPVAVPVPVPAVALRIAVGAPLQAARGTFFATRKGQKLHVDVRCRAIRNRDIRRLEIEGQVDEAMLCRICAP